MKNGGIDIYVRASSFACDLIESLQRVRRSAINQNLLAQVIKSGTSIGANLAEADGAPTRKDFLNKLSVAVKEGKETLYWLDLIRAEGSMDKIKCNELYGECEQLVKILVTIRKKSEESASII